MFLPFCYYKENHHPISMVLLPRVCAIGFCSKYLTTNHARMRAMLFVVRIANHWYPCLFSVNDFRTHLSPFQKYTWLPFHLRLLIMLFGYVHFSFTLCRDLKNMVFGCILDAMFTSVITQVHRVLEMTRVNELSSCNTVLRFNPYITLHLRTITTLFSDAHGTLIVGIVGNETAASTGTKARLGS